MYCKILVNWINQKIYFCLHIVNAFSLSSLSFYDKTNIVATWYGTGKEKEEKNIKWYMYVPSSIFITNFLRGKSNSS